MFQKNCISIYFNNRKLNLLSQFHNCSCTIELKFSINQVIISKNSCFIDSVYYKSAFVKITECWSLDLSVRFTRVDSLLLFTASHFKISMTVFSLSQRPRKSETNCLKPRKQLHLIENNYLKNK